MLSLTDNSSNSPKVRYLYRVATNENKIIVVVDMIDWWISNFQFELTTLLDIHLHTE